MFDRKLRFRILRTLFRPVVRYALSLSSSYQEIGEIIRDIMISEAHARLEKDGEKPSLSKISVLTGINRRQVTAVRRGARNKAAEKFDLLSKIVNRWEQDPQFQTKSGAPKVLSLANENNEFAKLAQKVSREYTPGTVLEGLERTGLVSRRGNSLKLIGFVSFMHTDPEQAFGLASEGMELLINCVHDNVQSPAGEVRNLHLHTQYDNVFTDEVPGIREWLVEQGATFHRKARRFLSRHDADINPAPGKSAGAKAGVISISWTKPNPAVVTQNEELAG